MLLSGNVPADGVPRGETVEFQDVFDSAVARWIISGNVEKFLQDTENLVVDHDYGLDATIRRGEERSVLVESLHQVFWDAIGMAPMSVAREFGDRIADRIAEKHSRDGISWSDIALHRARRDNDLGRGKAVILLGVALASMCFADLSWIENLSSFLV